MTTIDSQLPLWDRISSWLRRVAEVADFDNVQLTQLKTRIE